MRAGKVTTTGDSPARGPGRTLPSVADAAASGQGETIRVSIVEDDARVRASMARLIDGADRFSCVSQHESGERAIADLPGVRPDVVLMDINLPGMSGVECVRRLRVLVPSVQVVMLTVYEDTDLIFADNFQSGDLSAWSTANTDLGDLTVDLAAGMASTNRGMHAIVDDVASLFVQDDGPQDEDRFRSRFYFDPNGFDPGEGQGHLRTRIFIVFDETPVRRLAAVVLRRQQGVYALMGRARLDDNAQANTGFITIGDGPHVVEIDWKQSSGPDANDGWLHLWIDGAPVASRTGLDNNVGTVDFVRGLTHPPGRVAARRSFVVAPVPRCRATIPRSPIRRGSPCHRSGQSPRSRHSSRRSPPRRARRPPTSRRSPPPRPPRGR